MRNDENSNKLKESSRKYVKATLNIATNVVSRLMALKESNSKVFFGAMGSLVVVVILIVMMGGSSEKKLPSHVKTNITVGQTYELRSANTYEKTSKVKLVSVPGSLGAYDDTEAQDRNADCMLLPQGTKVKAMQLTYYKTVLFVQVEKLSGECTGRKGWLISTNLK